ncbi:hypothetical protein TNCV_2372391 [Trichonephila clavipes]|nr:hypothetical protein TNCV_2372391 [Trichonephila clavipes]
MGQEDIEEVSSELGNGGYRLQLLDKTSRTLLLSVNFSSGNEQNTKNNSQSLRKFLYYWTTYCTASSREFVGTMCAALIMEDKDILEFIQSSKNTIEADSDEENEMNEQLMVIRHPE